MSMYRKKLPLLNGIRCITDGGMETDLVFNHNIDLPEFAAYDLLRSKTGEDWLVDYFRSYVEIAQRYSLGLVLETPTWRANREWGKRIGDSPEELALFNRTGVRIIELVPNELAANSRHCWPCLLT